MSLKTKTIDRDILKKTSAFFREVIPFSNGELEFAAVYIELHKMAISRLRRALPGQSLSPTVLVNEVCLKLMHTYLGSSTENWISKGTFFAVASEAMRHVAIDYHRRRQCLKRGGDYTRVNLDICSIPDVSSDVSVLDLDEAIKKFELVHPAKAELVKLRFFVGMTMPECAQALDISLPTAERYWRFARAWLADQLGD